MFRKGPGLLLRDLMRGDDPQIKAVLAVLEAVDADVVLLQGVDYDLNSEALRRLAEAAGYAHYFARRPNSGRASGLDLDGDGRLGEPEDAIGFGAFSGQGGMAILSRFRIEAEAMLDHADLLWRDMQESLLPAPNDDWPSRDIHAALPLVSVAHWEVPVRLANGMALTLWAYHAAPPVFDGPEDRNGRRNHDQNMFWKYRMDGAFGPLPERFVLMGDANLDPVDGDGRKTAILALLNDSRLQDPRPEGASGTDTVDWDDPNPGDLRVSYILPQAEMRVVASGVFWPGANAPLAEIVAEASRHRLVWVDLDLSE